MEEKWGFIFVVFGHFVVVKIYFISEKKSPLNYYKKEFRPR